MYKFIEAIAWITLFEIGLFTIGIVIICIAYAIWNKKQKNQSNETV